MKRIRRKIVALLLAALQILSIMPTTTALAETGSVKVSVNCSGTLSLDNYDYYIVAGTAGNYTAKPLETEASVYQIDLENPVSDPYVVLKYFAKGTQVTQEMIASEDLSNVVVWTWGTSGFMENDYYKATLKKRSESLYEIDIARNYDLDPTFDVKIGLYDLADQVALNVNDLPNNYTYYLVVTVGDIFSYNDSTPYYTQLINFDTNPKNVSIETFAQNGGSINYTALTQEQKNDLHVYFAAVNNDQFGYLIDQNYFASISSINNDRYGFNQTTRSEFDGFTTCLPNSGHATGKVTNSDTNYQIGFRQVSTNENEVHVVLKTASGEAIESFTKPYYVWLRAHSDRYYHYVVQLNSNGTNTIDITLEPSWMPNSSVPFSSTWSVEAMVIEPKEENGVLKSITTGPIDKGDPEGVNQNDCNQILAAGGLLGSYTYSYDGITVTPDPENGKDIIIFNFTLIKPQIEETAITPSQILGGAYEYGIVADTLIQHGHTETNFAVKHFAYSGGGGGTDENIDIDGSGDGAIPFYVGDVVHKLRITSGTTVPVDLFVTQKDLDSGKIDTSTAGAHVERIPTSQSSINSYVQSLINKGASSSSSLARKTTIKPVISGTPTIDTTGLDDGITIYVDCSDITLSNSGWKIRKKPNQSIVFNVPGTNVHIDKFFVYEYKNGQFEDPVASTTSALNNDTNVNQKVDDVIFKHITFNAYQADTVNIVDASGLFLAPNASYVSQKNGAGWIVTGGTVDSEAEWHFYSHHRTYHSVTEKGIQITKELDESGTPVDFDTGKFEFELYETNNQWEQLEGGYYKTAKTDSHKIASFPKFTYDTDHLDKVPRTEQYLPTCFYYVLREKLPNIEGAAYDTVLSDGIIYNGKQIKIRVTATFDPGSETISTTLETLQDDGTWKLETENSNIYSLGTFVNNKNRNEYGSLKVTKTTTGGSPNLSKAFNFKVTLTNRTDIATETYSNIRFENGIGTFTLAHGGIKTIENLPVGTTFEVVETDADKDGYETTVVSNGTVVNNKTVIGTITSAISTADFTNKHFEEGNAEITIKKTFNNWTKKASFDFLLTAFDGAPMPADVAAGDTTKLISADKDNLTNTFGTIGNAEITIKKTFNNWNKKASFDFLLTAFDGAPMPADVAAGDTTKLISADKDNLTNTFGTIAFDGTADGEYKYTVQETNIPTDATEDNHFTVNGITYDTTVYDVKVVVTKNDNGIPTVEVYTKKSGEADTAYELQDGTSVELGFTNTYKAEGDTYIEATKAIAVGDTWPTGGTVTFTLEAFSGKDKDNNPIDVIDIPMPAIIDQEKSLTDEGTVRFGTITLAESMVGSTFKYKISETAEGFDGWSNNGPIYAEFTVVDDYKGHLIGTVSYTDEQDTITNTRDRGALKFKKIVKLNGNDPISDDDFALVDGDYTFHVKGKEGGTADGVTRDVIVHVEKGIVTTATGTDTSVDSGYAVVSNLPTGEYTITEELKDGQIKDGIYLLDSRESGDTDPDLKERTFSLPVTKNNTANIPGADFINNRNVGDLEIEKTVVNITNYDHKFTFSIKLTKPTTPAGVELKGEYPAKYIRYVPATAEDPATTTEQTVTAEVKDGVVSGIVLGANDKYIIYNLPAGTGYTVTEATPPAGYTQTTPANGAAAVGEIETGKTKQESFENTYWAEGPLDIEGQKIIENRVFTKDDTLTVKIEGNGRLPASSEITVPLEAGKNTADFSFARIMYDLNDMVDADGNRVYKKEFDYTITETATMAGTTAVLGKNRLHVVVTDMLNGVLDVKTKYYYDEGDADNGIDPVTGDKAKFINEYKAAGEIRLYAKKILVRETLEKGMFTFSLDRVDGKYYTEATEKQLHVPNGNVDGGDVNTALFGTIEYKHGYEGIPDIMEGVAYDLDDDGHPISRTTKITYVITEDIPTYGLDKDLTITYDETPKYVTVTLKDDLKGNITATFANEDGEELKDEDVTFTNIVTWLMKVDPEKNNMPLAGAKIEIYNDAAADPADKLVYTYTSSKEPVKIENLKTGVTYRLHETVAPNGYLLWSMDCYFMVASNGDIEIIRSADDSTMLEVNADGVILAKDIMKRVPATVKKIWNDDENRDGLRDKYVKVTLKRVATENGADVGNVETVEQYRSVELSDRNNWMFTATGLPAVNDACQTYRYYWTEDVVPADYTLTAVTNATITTLTNTHIPTPTQVSVEKKWLDNNNEANKRPASVKVQLYGNEQAVGAPVELNEGNNWSYTWKELYKNECTDGTNSKPIVYKVAEVEIPEGYVCTYEGNGTTHIVVKNTYETGKLLIEKEFDVEPWEPFEPDDSPRDIPVIKTWNDNDNKDGNRPGSVTVRLYADGVEVASTQLSADNNWRYTFTGLPRLTEEKTRINYTITEDPVEWYEAEIRGFNIRNNYKPELTSVSVKKVWEDNGDTLGYRPRSIAMKLNNGMIVILSDDNGWTATIENLPTRVNGQPFTYQWVEQTVLNYTKTDEVTEGTLTTFTNTVVRPPKETTVNRYQKRVDTPEELDEYDTPLGVDVIINHVGDCFD